MPDVAHLDDRTEAHIDGLRIAGDEGWDICKESLAWEEAGEIFTAAVLAFESGNDYRIKDVLTAGGEDPRIIPWHCFSPGMALLSHGPIN